MKPSKTKKQRKEIYLQVANDLTLNDFNKRVYPNSRFICCCIENITRVRSANVERNYPELNLFNDNLGYAWLSSDDSLKEDNEVRIIVSLLCAEMCN